MTDFDINVEPNDYPTFEGEPLDLDEVELRDAPQPTRLCPKCGWEYVPTVESVGLCRDCKRRGYGNA